MVFIGFNLWMLNRSVKNHEISKTGALSPFKQAGAGGIVSVLGLILSVDGVGLTTALI